MHLKILQYKIERTIILFGIRNAINFLADVNLSFVDEHWDWDYDYHDHQMIKYSRGNEEI